MEHSGESETRHRKNVRERRAMIVRWAEYVRTHEDAEWSRQQNTLIDSQLQSANDLARAGHTDPVRFAEAKDRLREIE